MRSEEVIELLESVGAVRRGHFELSSGRHSNTYVQCALVLQHPQHAERLARALAAEFHDLCIDCVAGLALGSITLAYEVARALGVRAIFVERDTSGMMSLRRGFRLDPGERVLIVEDVWTTGNSTCEAIQVVEREGGRAVAAGALLDRSRGRLELPVRAEALADVPIPSYEPGECPLCRAGGEAVKPGSRFLRAAP